MATLQYIPRDALPGTSKTLATALTAALLGSTSGSVMAQDASELAEEAPKKGYSLMLEEVIVTAQKREESAMSVPVTVNTFTAQDLVNTGATDIQYIDDYMPGVDIGLGSATQTSIEIRGIDSPNISTGGDPSVATFFDNAYMPRAATTVPFTDIDRVEVLKGPQGTLFGRNATAGVINILPNKPVQQEFEGFLKSRIGNEGLFRAEGMVNVPITDNLAARANVFYHERDGIINNVAIGDDIREEGFTSARLAFLWELSDNTSLQLAGDYEDRDENPDYSIGVSKYAFSMDPYNSKAENDVQKREENRDMYGVSLQLNHDFNDKVSVFAITSYRDWDTWNLQDEDGTAAARRYIDSNNIEDSDIWYNEIRFSFVDARWDIVAGGNYSEEDVYQRTNIGLLADSYMQFISLELLPEIGIDADQDTHAWDIFADEDVQFWLDASELAGDVLGNDGIAVLPPEFAGTYFTETIDNTGDFTNWGIFTDVSYQLTDTIRIIAGLRYSYDDKEYSWQTFPSQIMWPYPPVRVAYDPAETGTSPDQWYDKFKDDKDWSKTTGRLVLDWQFSDNAMTYLSYATGYKSGGFDGQLFSAWVTGPFDTEDVKNIEWGLKGDFLDNTLRTEVSVFHTEIDGRQNTESTRECESVDNCDNDPTAQPTIVSSDDTIEGIELILTWTPLDTLRLTGMTTARDSETEPDAYFDEGGNLRGGRKSNNNTDNEYTLMLDWTPNVPMGYLLVHVDYVYEEAEDDSEETIYTTGRWYFEDRELLNARIAWTNDSDNIEIGIWGKNLQDNEIADNPGGYVADTLGAYKTSIEDPRTYGIDFRYSF